MRCTDFREYVEEYEKEEEAFDERMMKENEATLTSEKMKKEMKRRKRPLMKPARVSALT